MRHRIFYLLGILIVCFFTVNHSAYAMKIIGFGNSITQGYPYVIDIPDGARTGGYEPELERLLSQSGNIFQSRFNRIRHPTGIVMS